MNSIFSRIFLMCTVTVAISPMDSISQILENNSSFVYTWLGFWARKVRRSNSFVVKFFSSPLIQTRRAVLSIFKHPAADKPLVPGQVGFYPGNQLAGAEGLGDVIIGSKT